ncbi:MAG: HAD family phosphatase [Clostridia bacterium]|nr:HAD family phosphatase [Clostridia bacterium]
MSYSGLVMDIDGTLYNSAKRITEATRQAIFHAREAGKIIAIASGRPVPGIDDVCRRLELDEKGGYIMGWNGGRIFNAQTGEVISETCLPDGIVPEIATLAAEYDAPVEAQTSDAIVSEQPDDPFIQLEARLNHMTVDKIGSLADYTRHPIYKCIITGSDEKLVHLEQVASRHFAGRLSVFRSEPYFLEILPFGIDKAHAIDLLAEHLGLTHQDFIACGDGFNDLSMIRHAGLGVAMANAQPVVRQNADYVTASCDEDGLVPVIEKFLLA